MHPIKTFLTVAAATALTLPAAALADAPDTTKAPSSAKQCKTMRAQMGDSAFRAAYGTNKKKSNAFGKCVSRISKARKAERRAAVETCRTQRAADADAFAAKYGTGKKQRNAFGKCVSAAAQQKAKDRAAAPATPQNDDNPGQSKKNS